MKNIFIYLFIMMCFSPYAQMQLGESILSSHQTDKNFGWQVSLSEDGMNLAISDYSSDQIFEDGGKIEVYEFKGDNWVKKGNTIIAGDDSISSGWKTVLSADGNRIAFSTNALPKFNIKPKILIYEYSNGLWNELANNFHNDHLIHPQSFSLSGDGNRISFSSLINDSFAASVFEYKNNVWSLVGSKLYFDNTFGTDAHNSLSFKGDTIAISFAGGNTVSSIHVYAKDNKIYNPVGEQIAALPNEFFLGRFLQLSNDGKTIVASGIDHHDGERETVRVFKLNGIKGYKQYGSTIIAPIINSSFGSSVSISEDGTRVAVGATGAWSGNSFAGKVYIYDFIQSNWVLNSMAINGEGPNEKCGFSVSLNHDGSRIAVGGPNYEQEGPGIGRARVFDLEDVINTSSISFENHDLTFYPNPTSGLIQINSSNGENLIVYNQFGTQIIKMKIMRGSHTFMLDLSQLENGIYFFQLDKNEIQKVVLMK